LVEHDLPVTTLAKLIGHTALSTTLGYIAGADPQVRQAYQAAMSCWTAASAAAPASTLARAAPEPALPPRTPPPKPAPLVTFETWGASLPAWVRTACLAYLMQRQKDCKPSRRQRNGARLLRALASFWRWQFSSVH